jgi:hypothetical protein
MVRRGALLRLSSRLGCSLFVPFWQDLPMFSTSGFDCSSNVLGGVARSLGGKFRRPTH